jgi:hypothetical protein
MAATSISNGFAFVLNYIHMGNWASTVKTFPDKFGRR